MYSGTFGGRAGRSKGKATKKKKKKKNKSDKDESLQSAIITGAGSGINHKTTREASMSSPTKKSKAKKGDDDLIFPQGFAESNDLFFDASCNICDTLDSLAAANKKKKNAGNLYHSAVFLSRNYGGGIASTYLKPGKKWNEKQPQTAAIIGADPLVSFVIGLSPAYDMIPIALDSDAEEDEVKAVENDVEEIAILVDEGKEELLAALDLDSGERIVGIFANLDYTPKLVSMRPGMSHASQLRRLRASASVASERDVPLQVRVFPGPDQMASSPIDNNDNDNIISPDVQVVKDLVRVLLEFPTPPSIHLSRWTGKVDHALKMLSAFPNIYIGLDASCGFLKASQHKKEMAFELQLDRLLLESGAAIPAAVALALGNKAFSHSGLLPFVAEAIAEQKPTHISALDVAKKSTENMVKLYGSKMINRAEAFYGPERCVETKDQGEQNQQESPDDSVGGESESGVPKVPVSSENEMQKKKKKKKKKRSKRNKDDSSATIGKSAAAPSDDFDDDFFAADDTIPPAPSV